MSNPELHFTLKTSGFPAEPSAGVERAVIRAEWQVPVDLKLLEGHFPSMPILPAVAMIEVGLELLRTACAERHAELVAVPSAKFMKPLVPGDRVLITARKLGEREWRLKWESEGQLVADFSMGLGSAGEIGD